MTISELKRIASYYGPWKVCVTYFKKSGKYYCEGTYLTRELDMFEIFAEAELMISLGRRPGLVDCEPGKNEFYALIEVPDHPHKYPHLVMC